MGITNESKKEEKKVEEPEKILDNGMIFNMYDSSNVKEKVPFIFAYENNDMFVGKK